MSRKAKQEQKQDFSSFLSVLIMIIGVLTILLVANTLIIASNPDNLSITSVFSEAADDAEKNVKFSNSSLEPIYLDVHPNHLVIYPGEITVSAADLEADDNQFQFWLNRVDRWKDKIYFVLLARPRSAILERKLEMVIRSRGIELGVELYEEDKTVIYKSDKLLMAILEEESEDTKLLEGEGGQAGEEGADEAAPGGEAGAEGGEEASGEGTGGAESEPVAAPAAGEGGA